MSVYSKRVPTNFKNPKTFTKQVGNFRLTLIGGCILFLEDAGPGEPWSRISLASMAARAFACPEKGLPRDDVSSDAAAECLTLGRRGC